MLNTNSKQVSNVSKVGQKCTAKGAVTLVGRLWPPLCFVGE